MQDTLKHVPATTPRELRLLRLLREARARNAQLRNTLRIVASASPYAESVEGVLRTMTVR